MLRKWWKTHENPRLLFPNPRGGVEPMRAADKPMHAGGVQAAMRAAVADCGIRLRQYYPFAASSFLDPYAGAGRGFA